MAHARLGPSNHRWPECPGSVREEEQYPDIAGEAAIDGTGSHLLLESCMIHGVRAEAYEGQIIGVNHEDKLSGWMVNQDRIKRVQECLDYIARRVSELKDQFPNCTVLVESETRSNPGEKYGRTDWWGTVDITITARIGGKVVFLEICDYKDGRSYVNVENNSQLNSYAAGKVHEFGITDGNTQGRLTIVQPKTGQSVRFKSVNVSNIIEAADELAAKAALTDDPDAPLKAGEHCKWCKHKSACKQQSMESVALIAPIAITPAQSGGSLFELINETFGDITAMSEEKLTELADARAGIESVFDKVEAELQRRIEAGVEVKGYAMLPGRSSNQWIGDEEEIVKMLKARRLKLTDIYPKKLISPAQALKLEVLTNEQKEKISKQYIEKKAGELKLTKVRESKTVEDKAAVFKDVVKQQQPSFF